MNFFKRILSEYIIKIIIYYLFYIIKYLKNKKYMYFFFYCPKKTKEN